MRHDASYYRQLEERREQVHKSGYSRAPKHPERDLAVALTGWLFTPSEPVEVAPLQRETGPHVVHTRVPAPVRGSIAYALLYGQGSVVRMSL